MTAQVITVAPQQRVTLRREWKARKHCDKDHVAWVCEDKLRQTLIASGKLQYVADYINSLAQESVPGLYEACCFRYDSQRTSGWHKMRWKISAVPLGEAADVLARLSAEHETSVRLARSEGAFPEAFQ
eukprot:7391813-Prymnesium_polylepis.9